MYLGRGPFSYLPPWMRPGWWFRGYCWWWPWPFSSFPVDPKTEIEWLKLEIETLREILKAIEERIRELEDEE
jgi:hypothetical protein